MRLASQTPKTRSKRKRYAVSPRLWVTLFVSSVIVHLLLIAAVQSMSERVSTAGSLAPIDVEFVSEDELAMDSQSVRPATRSETSPRPAAEPSPEPESQPETRLEFDNTIVNPSTPPEEATVPDSITPSPDPVTPSNNSATPPPASDTSEPRQQETPPSEGSKEPAEKPSPLPTPSGPARSGLRLPDVPNVRSVPPGDLGQKAPEEPTEETRVSQNPIPASFSATIGTTTLPVEVGDIPENPATLKDDDHSKTFQSSSSDCLLTPEALQSFGQTVVLRVAVDENGDVYADSNPEVQRSSENPSYDELAKCVVKTWKFNPAYDEQDGSPSYRSSNLDIPVTIN